MSIFKAYDIRGLYPSQLDEDMSYQIGRATAVHLGVDTIVVGRDARAHSPSLSDALCRGIRDSGVNVVFLGLVSTPMVYFAVEHLAAGGGIMVSASHNPGEYNGFKICREHAIPVGEAGGLKEIEALARAGFGEPTGQGELSDADITTPYLAHVLSTSGPVSAATFRVAIDCGNGMASVALVPLLEQLSLHVEPLFFEPDGTFPNHEADPLKVENLAWVAKAVQDHNCDFGVAFDGDGDRAVFVDGTGRPISSDLMTAVIARRQLEREPDGLVLYDLRSSRAVAEEVERLGGRSSMCRVGHSFVKAEMREAHALFAGELSGHFYFRFSDNLFADDAIAAFVNVLAVLQDTGETLAELVEPMRTYHASGEINRRVSDVDALLNLVEREHEAAPLVSRLDGLYVSYDDWWFNLRPSNTEPVLRLNLEAGSLAQMERERDALLARMAEYAPVE
ncbi:MAG: phosphomannomutase/phosphoglucomutase [Gammaproteobacteria bacterium]|nr:phosphomannomutase/phosphoglucomutase [Gammaproteobacteria bacterium]